MQFVTPNEANTTAALTNDTPGRYGLHLHEMKRAALEAVCVIKIISCPHYLVCPTDLACQEQPCRSQKALGMPVESAEKADSEGHIHDESGLQRWFFTSEPRISLPQDREDADSLCGLIGRPDKLTEEKLTEDC